MKRFSDAELSAEYIAADLTCWVRRARCDNYPGEDAMWDHYERGIEQLYILRRFLTFPHFDEVTA